MMVGGRGGQVTNKIQGSQTHCVRCQEAARDETWYRTGFLPFKKLSVLYLCVCVPRVGLVTTEARRRL